MRFLFQARHFPCATAMVVSLAAVAGGCVRNSQDSAHRSRSTGRLAAVVREARPTVGAADAALPRDTIERIDAPVGSAFVIPVDPALLVDASRPLKLLLDDGLELPARLYRVSVTPIPPRAVGAWRSWLPPALSWDTASISPQEAALLIASPEGQRVGFALLVEPKAGRDDTAVWMGTERVPMQWLPTIDTLALAHPEVAEGPWTLPFDAISLNQPQVQDAIAIETLNPLTRWRARLLEHGLRPGTPERVYEDPLLEAIAQQQERRVRVALARLWTTHPDVCERVKRRLATLAPVTSRVRAPVWETDQSVIDRLLLDLLNSAFSPDRRAQLAEQWLDEQPAAIAWVTDEGPAVDRTTTATGSATSTAVVTMLNLSTLPTTAWLPSASAEPSPEMTPVPPLSTVVLAQAFDNSRAPVVIARIGEWSRALAVIPQGLPASPPGLATGFFLPTPTMQDFIAGTTPAVDERSNTAALLHRPANAEADASAPEHRRWQLWVECRVPPGQAERSGDRLLLYAGPAGAPTAAWQINHDGVITSLRDKDALLARELGAEVARAEVTDLPDRWIARIPLPPGSLEEGRFLRLGLVRVDASGSQSAWPRPMLPWQTEPSRAHIDLSAWKQ